MNSVNLVMEGLDSSETSVPKRATLRDIPEDAILHSHRYEKLRSYILLYFLFKQIFPKAVDIWLTTDY
jgi:hypothetical protein